MGAGSSSRRKPERYSPTPSEVFTGTTRVGSSKRKAEAHSSDVTRVPEVLSTLEALTDECKLGNAAELLSRWELTMSGFSAFEEVARGTTSRVVSACYRGNTVAVKQLDSPQPAIWRNYIDREVLALSRVQHTNIVDLIGVCHAPESPCIVTALAETTLDEQLWMAASSASPLLNTRLLETRFLRGVAHGMAAVHAHRILHLDLKPANILISDGIPMVADFGLSVRFGKSGDTFINGAAPGTLPYKAPELFREASDANGASGVRVGPATDVYAFAMLIWQILAGASPWHGESQVAVMSAVLGGERPIEPSKSGDELGGALSALMSDCWAQQPTERPRFLDVASRLDAVEVARSLDEAATSDAARRGEVTAAEMRVQRAERMQASVQAQLESFVRAVDGARVELTERAAPDPERRLELQIDACEEELAAMRTALATLETDAKAGRRLAAKLNREHEVRRALLRVRP